MGSLSRDTDPKMMTMRITMMVKTGRCTAKRERFTLCSPSQGLLLSSSGARPSGSSPVFLCGIASGRMI